MARMYVQPSILKPANACHDALASSVMARRRHIHQRIRQPEKTLSRHAEQQIHAMGREAFGDQPSNAARHSAAAFVALPRQTGVSQWRYFSSFPRTASL